MFIQEINFLERQLKPQVHNTLTPSAIQSLETRQTLNWVAGCSQQDLAVTVAADRWLLLLLPECSPVKHCFTSPTLDTGTTC